jgi:hypothetical protein
MVALLRDASEPTSTWSRTRSGGAADASLVSHFKREETRTKERIESIRERTRMIFGDWKAPKRHIRVVSRPE